MYSMRTSCTGSARLFQAAALLIAMAAHSSAQSAGAIRITQSAPGYVAGATLTVSCEIGVDAGRQVQSLLWRPLLPSAWTLTGTVTGDGDPMLDPDGDGILFLGGDLTAPNPLVIQYHVAVPAGETGARILGGALEYQLDGMANPAWAGSDPLTLTDFDAAQESLGYLAGTRMTVTCTVSHPEGVALQSLLWRPSFPSENWTLVGAGEVTPGAAPEVDSDGEYVVLLGDISANPLAFTYTVLVPPDTAGEQEIRGRVEYQLTGMPNPAIAWAEPDPLVLQAMHTLEIVSPYGAPLPGAGLYTNFYGTLLTNAVNPAVTADNLDWGCAGWILSNHAPASGTGTNCLFTLTNNAVLSWIWVAPQVGNRTVTELETLAFQSSVAYTNDGFEPLHLLYTLDADSQSTGLAITADGAFSWTPNEAQGDASYTVTVTVTDNGAEPHWLTAAETFTITVVETNRPPVLEPISGQLADEQSTLTFTALASDPDLPAQALTFTLDPASLNAGMTIDAASGVFTWSPAPGQAAADPYTVTVTVTDNGLNPSALSASRTFSIGVVDSRATHASDGYLAGRTAEIHCTFEHPGDKALLSLLWRPLLPDGWALLGVDGQGDPAIDTGDGAMIFIGDDLNTPNPLAFTYWIAVPDGVTGPREIRAEAEYLVTGKSNPLTIRVNPEPLVLREMHTVEIVSAEGQCVPPVGIYTNWHGTNLSATVSTPLTAGTRTFACTGWTLAETNLAAVAGASAEVFWTLTNDVVLTWNWVAPLIEPTNVFTVAMDEDGIWQAPAISASEPYRPALVDQLNWTLLTAPTNGAATVEGTGAIPTIVYTPALDWYGTDRFTVQVADGLGGFDQATIIVVVNPVNDPPVLAPIGDRQTDEFTPLAFTVSATDVDIPVQNLTYTISGAPANAMFDTATGDFSWVPEAGEAGAEGATFTVTITVTDDGLSPDNQSDSETFTLTLLPVRATHSTIGYVPGELLAVDCQFDYPAGRVLQSLLWRPELPEGWTLTGVAEVSPGTAPEGDPDDGAILLLGSLDANPLQFRYIVQVPAGDSGTNSIGGLIEYQLDGMPNPGKVRAQPDPLIIPMLLKLPGLVVADKIYDGFTNATVAAYGDLAGIMDGHDVSLVTTGVVAWFDTPHVGSNAVVVSGFVLDGADAAWYAIDTHVVTAAIAQATLTVAADPQTKVYGDDNPPLTFQYSGFVNGEDMTVLDTVPAVGTTVTVATAVGVYTNAITVSGAVDNNYAFTYVPADFTITAKPVTVTADAQTKVYGSADPALTYAVAPALVEGDAFTGALSRAAGKDVGTYAIGQGTLALSGNYDLTYVGANLTITPAPLTVTADGKTKAYGAALPTLTASYAGFVDGDTADGLDTPVMLATTATAASPVGAYPITASGAADVNYTISYVEGTLTVTPLSVTVTADAQTKVYGSVDPALTYAVAPALIEGDAFTGALSRAAGEDVGMYAIGQGTLALSGNYDLTYVGANLTITPAPLTVTADGKTKAYGAALPTLTASFAGFVDGDTADGLDTPVMLATTATAASPVGAYPITASGAADANYTISYVEGTLTVTPLSVTVTADAQTKVYGAVDPALTYAVAPALVEGDAFTGALSRAAGEDVGTYAIGQGTLALNGNYALTVTGADFTITKATPVITSWPVASSIQLGQTLGDALLSGGEANVPGTFAFDNPGDAPGSGTTAHAVTFTPTDTLNFSAVAGSIPVTVFAEPTLAEIAAQTVDELTLLTFQATVTNPDQLAGELAYSLDVASLAAGMAIDEQTGLFSWIPSELQGPGEYAVTLTVADGAGSAPAVTPLVSESFEGLPLGSSIDGVNGWQGDGATVVNDPSGPAGYLVDLPLPGDHTQTLQVTESVTLITNATGITTLDLMLRPEPVDALPEMPPDAQSAFAFNTDGDLLIYHSTNTLAGFAPGWSTMTLADKVTSGEWVRLMIVTDYITSDPPNPMFQISIDGTPVSSPLARQTADIDGTADGTWFIAAAGATVGGGASQFNALNIQGSGVLDDVVLQSATSGGGAGSGGGGLSDSVTFTITVNEVNQAPVAHDDGFTVAEGGQLDIPVPGVLANDTDADFPTNTLSAVLLAGTGNGDLTLDADGSFTYTHNGGETTSDSFTYSVFDGLSNSAPATVAIAVTPVNDAPFVATPLPDLVRLPNFDPFTVELGGVFTDPEGDPFVLNVVLAGEGAGAYLTGSTLTVTNFADAGGLLSIEVQATETLTDPRLIGTTSFTLTVAPVCNLTQNKGYGSIQAALDDAQTNDSIVVASGTYPGNFIVATPVVLTGSGEGQTILDGGGTGSVVAVLADQTTISGFTIEHSGGTAGDAGILLDGVSGCSVTGNTIQSAVIGIHVVGASGNEMAGNTVTNNVTGVLVDAGWQDEVWMQSEANGFTANNLSGNASASMQYGTEQTAGTQAISNWWGAADGPSGAGQGTGGAVAEGVVFTPWYTDAALSNLVPYDLRLDNTSIVENAPIGSEVGRFIVNDDDAGDVQVFRLASGNGTNDVDNACFSVNGASLLTSVELNYPSKAFYRIFAEVDDGRGGTNWAAIVVSVENVNDAPVAGAIHLVAVAGHSLAFDAAAYCQDLDGDTLTVTVSDPPAGLDTARADGLLAYLGTQADVGTLVTFAYTVSDGQLSAQGTVDIEVVATIEDYLSKALAITRIVPVSGEAAASCVLHFPAIWTEDGAVTYEVLQRPDFLTGDWTVATDSTLTFMPTADGFYGVMHALVPVPSGASRMFFKVQATVGGL